MNRLLYLACLVYNCSEADIKGKSRNNNIVMARYLFWALAVTNGGFEEAEAIRFINRDRAMRYHFMKVVDNLLKHDKDFIIQFHYANKFLNMYKQ